ncbi:hypothetical protein [Synechococcus sp. CC9616]|uniref:hypothetical protein n=1 Tax=Synechococcus sp. CC9616 TaxID=110663 RepID=UPI00048F0E02|nr:hypothetical protein [Synechococcus sp. CC9616]
MKLFFASIAVVTCCFGVPANAYDDYLQRTGPSLYGPGSSYNHGDYHDHPYRSNYIRDQDGNEYRCDFGGYCEAE